MTDADITAFRPAPLPVQPPRRRVWPWLLGGLLLLAVLAAGAVAALLSMLGELGGNGIHLSINDEIVDIASLHGAPVLASLLLALAVVAVVVLVVVPLVVAIGLLGATVGVAAALFVAALVLAVPCSPLLLIVGLVWLIVRPRRRAVGTA